MNLAMGESCHSREAEPLGNFGSTGRPDDGNGFGELCQGRAVGVVFEALGKQDEIDALGNCGSGAVGAFEEPGCVAEDQIAHQPWVEQDSAIANFKKPAIGADVSQLHNGHDARVLEETVR